MARADSVHQSAGQAAEVVLAEEGMVATSPAGLGTSMWHLHLLYVDAFGLAPKAEATM